MKLTGRRLLCFTLLGLTVGSCAPLAGLPTTGPMPEASMGFTAPNVARPDGPVAVMPVVFRELGPDPDKLEERYRQTAVLAAVGRQFTANLLESKGLPVIPFADLDSHIADVMPDHWNEDNRAPEKLRRLAQRTGAKQVLFTDMDSTYSYKRMTAADYVTYQLGSPDIVGAIGRLEVYSHSGEPIRALTAVGEIPAGTTIEALAQSALCIGANFLLVNLALPEPGPQMRRLTTGPGQHEWVMTRPQTREEELEYALRSPLSASMLPSVPLPVISADRQFYAEAKAREMLIKQALSVWLQEESFGDSENEPVQVTGETIPRSFHSLDITDVPQEPISIPKGAIIGVLVAGYDDNAASVAELLNKEMGKYQVFQPFAARFAKKGEEAGRRFTSKVVEELRRRNSEQGHSTVCPEDQHVWRTGSLQDISSPILIERAHDIGCDVLILLRNGRQLDLKGTSFEITVRILDVHSGKSQKHFIVGPPDKVGKVVAESLFPGT